MQGSDFIGLNFTSGECMAQDAGRAAGRLSLLGSGFALFVAGGKNLYANRCMRRGVVVGKLLEINGLLVAFGVGGRFVLILIETDNKSAKRTSAYGRILRFWQMSVFQACFEP